MMSGTMTEGMLRKRGAINKVKIELQVRQVESSLPNDTYRIQPDILYPGCTVACDDGEGVEWLDESNKAIVDDERQW